MRDQLVAGDVLTAQIWSTTAAAGDARRAEAGFRLSRGRISALLRLRAILRESSRTELAHQFLDFLLRPEVAAANARAAETATANGVAQGLLPRDPVLYPDPATYARGIWPTALPSDAQRYRDRLWTEIKSA